MSENSKNDLTIKARKKALILLTDKDRTTSELHDKLIRAGFDEEAAADAIAYVSRFGYLNDARYAEHYIDVMSASRSRERIRFDLLQKGLTARQINEAFEAAGETDEKPLIRHFAEKKLRSLREDDPRRREKVIRHLAGKGFKTSDIIAVLDDLTEI